MLLSVLLSCLGVLALWWLATGLVLVMQQGIRTPGHGHLLMLMAAGAVCVLLLVLVRDTAGSLAAWAGLLSATALWGCLELSHSLGLVTGVHRRHCPPDCTGWPRFRLALGASIYHELSVLVIGVALSMLLAGSPNSAGLYTFLVLWLMRWSAKLNLFAGVPNFSDGWFPLPLAHLSSYLRRRRVTLVFLISIGVALVGLATLWHAAERSAPEYRLAHVLPAVLLGLAILEHLFMALPINDSRLWKRFERTVTVKSDDTPVNTSSPESIARGVSQ